MLRAFNDIQMRHKTTFHVSCLDSERNVTNVHVHRVLHVCGMCVCVWLRARVCVCMCVCMYVCDMVWCVVSLG